MGAAAEAGLALEVRALRQAGTPVVVVHGGGPEIDRALAGAGLTSTRVNGLRVTDGATLAVTEHVLNGTLNARLAHTFRENGVPAVGLSGSSGILYARQLSELGFVGEVESVDCSLLHALLADGTVPVLAPLARRTGDEQVLNVNADTAGGAVAAALGAEVFILKTNVERVRARPGDAASGIDRFDVDSALTFAGSAACEGNMRPKMQAAIAAVRAGVERAAIGCASIEQMLEGDATVVFG